MTKLIPLFTFTFLLHLSTFAAVPQQWTVNVDSSIPEPHSIHAYHGETIDMEATLKSYGHPMTAASTARFLWQTNGMGNAWWQTNATCSAGVVRARFTPAMDPGANAVTFFLEVTDSDGSAFRPNGKIILSRSPGTNPETADLPPPGGTIDFARITYLNAPWCTLEAAEAAVESGVQRSLNAVENLSNSVDQTYAKLSDIPDVPSIAGLATTGEVNRLVGALADELTRSASTNYQPLAGMADYARKSDLPTDYLTESNLVGYATNGYADDAANAARSAAEASASTNYQPLAGMADYARKSDLPTDYLTESNLVGYATSGDVNRLVGALADELTRSAATNYQPIAGMADYARISDIPEVPSLDGYATKSYVEYAVTAAVIGTGSEDFAIRLLSPDGSTYQTADGSVYQITIAPAETNWINVAWPTMPLKYQGNNTWADDYDTLRWREDDNTWELSDNLYGIFEANPAEGLQATNITLHCIEIIVPDKVFARIIVDAHPVTNKINQVIYTDTLAEATNATLAAANAYTDAHSGGGGSGGVDTNAVIDIANATIATNPAITTLTSSVSTLTSDVSRLESNKLDKTGGEITGEVDFQNNIYTRVIYADALHVDNLHSYYSADITGPLTIDGDADNNVYTKTQTDELVAQKADEFTEWVPDSSAPALQGQPVFIESSFFWVWTDDQGTDWITTGGRDAVALEFRDSSSVGDPFTAIRKHVLRTGDAATPQELAEAISTNNPAFVSAVRSTPPDPDTPWGTYGTLGAAIAGIIAALANKLTKGLDDDGVPTDANVQELFSESNTSTAANPDFNNKVLKNSVNKLIDASLPIPLSAKTGNFTTESYKRFVVASMPSAGLTLTMHTPTGTNADVFECRFDGTALTADASVTFTGATVTKMEGETDTGVVKAGKVSLMSAFWNGTTWDVNWKVEG